MATNRWFFYAFERVSTLKTGTSKLRSSFLVFIATFSSVLAGVMSIMSPAAADSTLCSGSSFSTCINAGYTAHGYQNHYTSSYWKAYAGHNCTNYVGYMLDKNGDPGPGVAMGNGEAWDNTILAHPEWGYTVNDTAAVGAIAQWEGASWNGWAGHVAYVESVGSNSITISEDQYPSGPFQWRIITEGSSAWPDDFLHIADVGSSTTAHGTDFNGNGQSDILWYGPGTDVDRMWYGSSVRSVQFNKDYDESVTVNGTYTPVTGDFDGDGYRDILWYGPGTANDEIWYGTGTAGDFDKNYEITIGGTYTPVVGDFTDNGQDDILWYGSGSANDEIWYGSKNRTFKFNKDYEISVNGTYTPVVGYFDDDTIADILWYGPGTANDEMWYGNGVPGDFDKGYEISIGGNYTPVVGNFNGNPVGQDDILWYGSGSANDEIWFGSSSRTAKFNTNYEITVGGTYVPVSGDFDGDGYGDILWYGPGAANDEIRYGTSTPASFNSSYEITVNGDHIPVT